jgi:hypothetical protein
MQIKNPIWEALELTASDFKRIGRKVIEKLEDNIEHGSSNDARQSAIALADILKMRGEQNLTLEQPLIVKLPNYGKSESLPRRSPTARKSTSTNRPDPSRIGSAVEVDTAPATGDPGTA